MINIEIAEQSEIIESKDEFYKEITFKIFGITLFKKTFYSEYPEDKNKNNNNRVGFQTPKPLIETDENYE